MTLKRYLIAYWVIQFFLFTPVCFCSADSKAVGVEQLPKNKFNTVMESPTGDSAALFVGVNEFAKDNGLASLNFAVNDAIAQAHLFVRELKLIPAKNCILALSGQTVNPVHQAQLKLLKKDGIEVRPATKSDILSSLTVINRLPVSSKDMIIVSFSSHGFENGQGIYIMPADGLRSYLADTAIRSKILSDGTASSKAGKKLVFIDACRERVDKSKSSGSGNAMSQAFKKAFATSTGQATLMSCDVGQYSYEDPVSGQGVFTQFLLEGLRGKAKIDENGFVTIGSVSGYVTENVRRWIVRNIQRIPLRTARESCGGRPDIPGSALGFGMYSAIRCHCSLVRSITHISALTYLIIEVLG